MFSSRPLEEFVGLVTSTQAGGKKELRLSIESSRRVADSITYLLLELETLRLQNSKLTQANQESRITDIEFQGGKF
jgi:hypothetical protein